MDLGTSRQNWLLRMEWEAGSYMAISIPQRRSQRRHDLAPELATASTYHGTHEAVAVLIMMGVRCGVLGAL